MRRLVLALLFVLLIGGPDGRPWVFQSQGKGQGLVATAFSYGMLTSTVPPLSSRSRSFNARATAGHQNNFRILHYDLCRVLKVQNYLRLADVRLFAHHPQKKAIKKVMDRRPKKHRPSDINRNNVNLGKCITKIGAGIPDYTIVPEEGERKQHL